MKIWSALFNIFAILMLVMLSVAYLNVDKVVKRDFDQARLNQAVEFSTEETFRRALAVEDIGIDYSNLDVVSINTGEALNIFETLMCMNYDLSVSDNNKNTIEQSIVSIALTGNDGFYVTQSSQDDTTPGNSVKGQEYPLKWSVKIPYLMTDGDKTYALNIGREAYASITSSGKFDVPVTPGYPPGITKAKAMEVANSTIQKRMIKEAETKHLNDDPFSFNFQLPTMTTKKGVNPIDGPGILVIMQGASYASSEKIGAVSVSGFKTMEQINIVAFTENVGGVDRKYYCYNGQMDPYDIGARYKIQNYYHSMKEAAEAGYAPHYGLLTKKITTK